MEDGGRLFAARGFNSFCSLSTQYVNRDDFLVFREFLKDGSVYFDVGANVGITTVLASLAAKRVRIVAFEPTAECAEVWRKNIKTNGIENATLFECALGETSGSMDFITEKSASVANRLNLGSTLERYAIKDYDPASVTQIPVTTIDEVCARLGIQQVSLLKIDVEGAEPAVLRGAGKMLQNRAIQAVFLEFVPEYMRDMGEDIGAFVESIYSYGYVGFEIGAGRELRPLSRTDLRNGTFAGPNVVLRPGI
jgi:FkbM family methyltransferase